jgi:hypothetical protein
MIPIDDPSINITFKEYKYRTYLNEQTKFNNIVNIQDPLIIKRIQMNYRLTLLKDTAIARWAEEPTLVIISNVFSNTCKNISDR